jgi:hypothetical protein
MKNRLRLPGAPFTTKELICKHGYDSVLLSLPTYDKTSHRWEDPPPLLAFNHIFFFHKLREQVPRDQNEFNLQQQY